jgi:hypothetical protein
VYASILAPTAVVVSTPQPFPHNATPKAINTFPAFPQAFFARPAELVAPELISYLLVKR